MRKISGPVVKASTPDGISVTEQSEAKQVNVYMRVVLVVVGGLLGGQGG